MYFHISLPLNSSKIHTLSFKKKSTESNLCCPYTHECTGVWLTCKKGHTKKTEFPSPRSYQFAKSSSVRGSSSSPSSLCMLWLQLLSQALHVCVKSRKHCHAPSLALRIFLSPLLQWTLSLGRRVCDTNMPFRGEHSATPHFLHLDRLWFSVLIMVYWKKAVFLITFKSDTNLWV